MDLTLAILLVRFLNCCPELAATSDPVTHKSPVRIANFNHTKVRAVLRLTAVLYPTRPHVKSLPPLTSIMGRLHSNGKGISSSAIPYSRSAPAWLKTTPEQVVEQICKLAKKGATPSQIGVVLRDSHGVAQVKVVTGKAWIDSQISITPDLTFTGNKILRILKSNGTVSVT